MNWTPRAALPGVNAQNSNTDEIVTAFDPRGVQWCVWRDGAPLPANAFELHFARRAYGKAWKQSGVIYAQNNPHLPALAVAPDGTKVLAWEEQGTQHRVGVLEFTAASKPTTRKLLPNPGLDSDFHPALCVGSDGVRHIVYSHAGIITHASSLNSKRWGLELVSPAPDQYHPAICADGNDLYFAWLDIASGRIYLSSKDARGVWNLPQVLGYGTDVHLAARDGLVVAVWLSLPEHRIVARAFVNGKWGEVQDYSDWKGSYHPRVAIDSKGLMWVSWMQYLGTGDKYRIYVSRNGGTEYELPDQSDYNEGHALALGTDDSVHVVYLSHEADGKRAWSTDSA